MSENKKGNSFLTKVDSYFKVSHNGSTIRTEIIAGLVTFLAMVYILTVNPGAILGFGGTDPRWSSLFIATAIGAVIGTLLMAFVAKMPLAQASGMGLNFVVGGLIGGGLGLSFGNVMLLVLISGLIFLVVSIVPVYKDKQTNKWLTLREKIFDGIPTSVRSAITVGIGLFIAYLGLTNGGIILKGDGLSLVDFSLLFKGETMLQAAPAFVCLVGLVAIVVLAHFKVKGAVIFGILIATVVAIPFGVADVKALGDPEAWKFWNHFATFFSFDPSKSVFASVFTEGFDFSGYSGAQSLFALCATTIISFSMIDMFDTMGTVVGCTQQAGLVDETGKPLNYNKIMISDSVATVAGALCGTSTVTTFIESGSGVAEGGKTGLTALTTACFFFLSIFLLPLFAFIPGAATAAALIYVGILMMGNVKYINFADVRHAAPAFMTIIMMVCAASITDGIGFGMITYVVIELIIYVVDLIKHAVNKDKYAAAKWVISPVALVVSALFVVYFVI